MNVPTKDPLLCAISDLLVDVDLSLTKLGQGAHDDERLFALECIAKARRMLRLADGGSLSDAGKHREVGKILTGS